LELGLAWIKQERKRWKIFCNWVHHHHHQCNTSIREDAKWEQMGPDSWGWRIFFFCFFSFSSFFLWGGWNWAFVCVWDEVGDLVSFDVVHLFVAAASDPLHLLIDHLSCLLNCRCCCFFKRKKKKSSRPK
jgi:hypothetical protein